MRYIRREKGKMVGHYANPTPGYKEEEVPDDHPDILAWTAAREEVKQAVRADAERRGKEEKALYSRVAALEEKLLKLSKVKGKT
jgi:hypothetical protein